MNDKERLKGVEDNADHTSLKSFGDGGRDAFKVEKTEIFKDDFDWLIQQAQRVSGVEIESKLNLLNRIDNLRNKVSFLEQQTQQAEHVDELKTLLSGSRIMNDESLSLISELRSENQRYKRDFQEIIEIYGRPHEDTPAKEMVKVARRRLKGESQ